LDEANLSELVVDQPMTTVLENSVQMIRMLMICLENWEGPGPLGPLAYATGINPNRSRH